MTSFKLREALDDFERHMSLKSQVDRHTHRQLKRSYVFVLNPVVQAPARCELKLRMIERERNSRDGSIRICPDDALKDFKFERLLRVRASQHELTFKRSAVKRGMGSFVSASVLNEMPINESMEQANVWPYGPVALRA